MNPPKTLVRDYMKSLTTFFMPNTSIEEVAKTLVQKGVIGAPVLDEQHKMVGFITEQDCIRQLLNDAYYAEAHQVAADIMRTDTIFVPPDMDVLELAQSMLSRRPKLYPVCDNGKVVGIITRSDVLRALSKVRAAAAGSHA